MTPISPPQRLLGTWRSDRRRTFRHWKPPGSVAPTRLRKFKAMFGHLTIRWTKRRCYSDMQGARESSPYEVVAWDDDSIVIRMTKPMGLFNENDLIQIHFEGDHYWMGCCSGFVEWCRRVEAK